MPSFHSRIKTPTVPIKLCAALANLFLQLVGWGCEGWESQGGGVISKGTHISNTVSPMVLHAVRPVLYSVPPQGHGRIRRPFSDTTGPTARLHACACFELVLESPLGEALHVMTCMTHYHWLQPAS